MITIAYIRERLNELHETRLRHKAGSGTAARGGAQGIRSRKAAGRGGTGRTVSGRPGSELSQKAARKTAASRKTTTAPAKTATRAAGQLTVSEVHSWLHPAGTTTAGTTKKTVTSARTTKKSAPAKKETRKATRKTPEPISERQIRFATINARKYSTLEAAERALDSNRMMVPILRGRDGRFWVPATNREAGRLIRSRQATEIKRTR
jgi:hypothetical protein